MSVFFHETQSKMFQSPKDRFLSIVKKIAHAGPKTDV